MAAQQTASNACSPCCPQTRYLRVACAPGWRSLGCTWRTRATSARPSLPFTTWYGVSQSTQRLCRYRQKDSALRLSCLGAGVFQFSAQACSASHTDLQHMPFRSLGVLPVQLLSIKAHTSQSERAQDRCECYSRLSDIELQLKSPNAALEVCQQGMEAIKAGLIRGCAPGLTETTPACPSHLALLHLARCERRPHP